jgi:surface protein
MRLKLLSGIKSSITGFLLVLSISAGAQSANFILTFNTEGGGASGETTITLPFLGTSALGHYDVDFNNDGVFGDTDAASLSLDDLVGTQNITFAAPGVYTIQIRPSAAQNSMSFGFKGGSSPEKLISVDNWGSLTWQDLDGAFYGCTNMNVLATDVLRLYSATDMSDMFRGASNFNGDISAWDVSSVDVMSGLFRGASNFNGDLSAWDVSSVAVMNGLFGGASNFNGDISTWDVSSVTNMGSMFNGASNFNRDVSAWDVSSVTNMNYMFLDASNSMEI